jgi:hypothetical protein
MSLSTKEDSCILACPDEHIGWVKVSHFNKDKTIKSFKVHDTAIANMKLNQDGTLLATASQKGTLIRVFNTWTQEQVCELRRGAV